MAKRELEDCGFEESITRTSVEMELKTRITAKVDKLYYDGCKALEIEYKSLPVEYDLTGCTAGRAFLKEHKIVLNWELLVKNEDEFFSEVLAHEIGHILAYRRFKDRGHGDFWKYVMSSILGISPRRCHHMDVSEVKRVKHPTMYEYYCKHCSKTFQLSARLHSSIQKGNARICLTCRNRIQFTGRSYTK